MSSDNKTLPLPAGPGVAAAALLARAIIRLFTEQRWELLPDAVHPDADIEPGWGVPGARFGKQELLDGAWVATTSGAYQPEYEFIESLDDQTALVIVKLRYDIGTECPSERDAAYLMTFADELLRVMRVFDSADAALAAHGRAGGVTP